MTDLNSIWRNITYIITFVFLLAQVSASTTIARCSSCEKFNRSSIKLKRQETKLKDFTRQTGLARQAGNNVFTYKSLPGLTLKGGTKIIKRGSNEKKYAYIMQL